MLTWVQRWSNLLFLHWPMPIAELQQWLPTEVEIDPWDGHAWLSFVLFRLRVRPAWLPFLPGLSALTEVNLRTYVRCRGRPGVWFLSMHADNRWAVRLARVLTPLPYHHANLSYRNKGDAFHLTGSGALSPGEPVTRTFQPMGKCRAASANALDAWLLERYRAFAPSQRFGIVTAEVSHVPWLVQEVKLSSEEGGLGQGWGFDLTLPPKRAHYASGVDAHFGRFRPVGRSQSNCLPAFFPVQHGRSEFDRLQ